MVVRKCVRPLNRVCGCESEFAEQRETSELWCWNIRRWSVVLLFAWQHAYVPVCVYVWQSIRIRRRKMKCFWSKRARVRVQGQHTYASKPTQQKIKYALWMPWCSCRFCVSHHHFFASASCKFYWSNDLVFFLSDHHHLHRISLQSSFFFTFACLFLLSWHCRSVGHKTLSNILPRTFYFALFGSLIKWPIA